MNERQEEIIELLKEKKRTTVKFLSKRLFVSEMTIRRDLIALEKQGYLSRYHGGAIITEDDSVDAPFSVRLHLNELKKREMAKAARKYIKDGQIIFLEHSSTCAYLVPFLNEYKNITLITNSVIILSMLTKTDIKCFLTGGEYITKEKCLLGRETENYLRDINADIAFVSCDALSNDGILTDKYIESAEISRIMVKNSAKCVFLVDKSKMNLKYTYTICSVDEADEVIIV